MRALMTVATASLLLCACGDGEGNNAVGANAADANAAAPSTAVANQLQSLPEGQRNAVFIRAVLDAGQECQGVESSSFVRPDPSGDVWTATCTGERSYTIVVAPDGAASVTPGVPAQPGNSR